jgi:hypothetical protein
VFAYEFEVVRPVPEIGARVWDVLVWRYPELFLCRKRDGHVTHWPVPLHFARLALADEGRLTPLHPATPSLSSLAAAVGWRSPPPEPCARHLRLVE